MQSLLYGFDNRHCENVVGLVKDHFVSGLYFVTKSTVTTERLSNIRLAEI